MQSSFIHGIAGLALALFALATPGATSTRRGLSPTIKAAGVTVAVVSLLRVVFAAAAAATASSTGAVTSQRLFHDRNTADAHKLVLVAVFAVGLDDKNVEEGRRILEEKNHPLVTLVDTMDGAADKLRRAVAAATVAALRARMAGRTTRALTAAVVQATYGVGTAHCAFGTVQPLALDGT